MGSGGISNYEGERPAEGTRGGGAKNRRDRQPVRWAKYNADMNEPQPISPRLRLQALLAIPDRQRTDAQWDEINELEIALAPGNREGIPEQGIRRNATAPAAHPKPGGRPHGKRPVKKFHKRPPKGTAP